MMMRALLIELQRFVIVGFADEVYFSLILII